MKTLTTLASLALASCCALSSAQAQDGTRSSLRWTPRGLLNYALEELIAFEHRHALEQEGLALARRAVKFADEGNIDDAITTLKSARLSWSDAPQLPHMIADLYEAQGNAAEALTWYAAAAEIGEAFRAHYHSGQIVYERAEAAMKEAGVPPDAATFPVQPSPELEQAVHAGMDALDKAREYFLDALLDRADDRASESVSAITKRIDELQEMLDKIERPEEDEENEDENEEGDEQNEDQEDNEDSEGEGDPEEEGQPNEDQEPPEDDEGDQPQDQEGPPPSSEPVTKEDLTPEQIQRLEDKLEELEALAARLDALARQRQRDPGERDW